jgi:hypothetical protein
MSSYLNFIIGHVRPSIPFPPEYRFVTSSPIESSDFAVSMYDVDSKGLTDNRIGEYAFLFALRSELQQRSLSEGLISIAQYRRFVLNRPVGQRATNPNFAWIISPDQAAEVLTELAMRPRHGDWLISTATRVSSCVTDQYARKHIIRDWFRFLADSLDNGLLTQSEARDAALLDVMIPAPSNGVFPLGPFISMLQRLEEMALAFLRGGFLEREGYQRRALGFCLERMHSYLLVSEICRRGTAIQNVQGFHTVVQLGSFVAPTL